jgi:hypothetical protein
VSSRRKGNDRVKTGLSDHGLIVTRRRLSSYPHRRRSSVPQLLTLSAMALEVLIVGYRKCPYLAQVYIPTPTLYGPELITGDAIRAADW